MRLSVSQLSLAWPWLQGIAEASLAIVLAVVLADLVWSLVPEPQPIDPSGWHVMTAADAGRVAGSAVPSAAARALFGEAPDAAAFAGPIAPAQLNLTLKGILAERDSARQVAVIAEAAGPEKIYAKGDRISDATIAWIEPRRVVLERNGRREALTWPGEDKMAAYRQAAAPTAAPVPSPAQAMPELLRQAQTEPYLEDGRPAGFRLVWIDPESLINDLGMRPDDVIRTVNGVAVNDIADLWRAYQQVQNETTVRVGVRRATEELSFDVPVR